MTTPNDPFSTPSTGFEKLQDYKDQAMIVTPRQRIDGLVTQHCKPGETTSAVDADAVILYPNGTVKELSGVRVFSLGLVAQFSRQMGQMILGRITLGKSTKGNDVWIMSPATDADKALGMTYWTRKASGQFQAPAATPAPAPQPATVPAGASADPFAA